MKPHYCLLFCFRELAVLEVWTEVIGPSQPAALATSLEPYNASQTKEIHHLKICSLLAWITNFMYQHIEMITGILWDEAPVPSPMLGNVRRELVVFLRCPLSPFYPVLLTARNASHIYCLTFSSAASRLKKFRWISPRTSKNVRRKKGDVSVYLPAFACSLGIWHVLGKIEQEGDVYGLFVRLMNISDYVRKC